ncbi:uncharacterized protein LOC128683344 isoform X2 [Plodia interpunctella]|nr:uncharacterized protein LOC128683344 isoform X2 [Plodia interpunctella]
MSTRRQVKLHFMSNSSINSELNATQYQITATAARLKPPKGCAKDNETLCTTLQDEFCFTSGVVCDGIKNCGVPDWFDERKSDCGMPEERLSYAPVIAVMAAVLCALMIVSHFMSRCLPPLTNTFFIFNTNEDNRLCIDPVLIPPDEVPLDKIVLKKTSIIPVPSTSSSSEVEIGKKEIIFAHIDDEHENQDVSSDPMETGCTEESFRRITVRTVSAKIQEKLRSLKKK